MRTGDKVKVTKATIQELTRLHIPKTDIDRILTGITGRVVALDACTVAIKFEELEGIQTYQFFKKYIEVVE